MAEGALAPARGAGLALPARAATAMLAAMPLAAALANRSGPLVLALAALLALIVSRGREGPGALDRLFTPLRQPTGLAALAFLAWCALTLAWSPAPGASARALAEFGLALAGGLAVARLLGPRLDAGAVRLGALGAAVGALAVVVSLATDLAPQRLLASLGWPAPRPFPEIFNRGALTLVVIGIPLCWRLARDGRRAACFGLALLVAAAAFTSQSLTAALAAVVGAATYVACRVLPPHVSLTVARLALLAALVVAPVVGDLLARGLPEAAHRALWSGNSAGRVAIARSFGAVVEADPWRGMGFAASARADETPAAALVGPELCLMLRAGHPHDAALQVWAELGIVGAALAALALLLALNALAVPDRKVLAPRLALVAAVAAASLVGHGAWQGWWAAAVGAAAAWLVPRPSEGPG